MLRSTRTSSVEGQRKKARPTSRGQKPGEPGGIADGPLAAGKGAALGLAGVALDRPDLDHRQEQPDASDIDRDAREGLPGAGAEGRAPPVPPRAPIRPPPLPRWIRTSRIRNRPSRIKKKFSGAASQGQNASTVTARSFPQDTRCGVVQTAIIGLGPRP